MPSPLTSAVLRGCSFLYGFTCFNFFTAMAILDGTLLRRPPRSFWDLVEKERRRIWDLSEPADNGLGHAFHTLENGAKVHYLTNYPPREVNQPRNLVIFMHGWPGSCHIWHTTIAALSSELVQTNRLIAFDLPGQGGSDGLSGYGPDDMLEAITEFILAMREQYLSPDGKVILVGHDWGALIGFRLASEAPALADRFILTNAGLPSLAKANITSRLALSRRMAASWLRSPLNLKLLRNAFSTLAPVLRQLNLSSYIFIFNLPRFLASRAAHAGNSWFLRTLAAFSLARPRPTHDALEPPRLASTLGPPLTTLSSTTPTTAPYGASTHSRVLAGPRTAFFESIRLYRDGLALRPWRKSLPALAALHNLAEGSSKRRSSSGAGLIEDGPPGALKAPTTILWGDADPAADARIMLEGVADYLAPRSQCVVLPGLGHWTPVERPGAAAIAAAVGWSLGGEDGDVGVLVGRVCEGARVSARKA